MKRALLRDCTQQNCSSHLPISSVQFCRSVMSDSLRPHELQHARPPCPSQTPGVHPNSCPSIGDAIQPSHPLLSPSPSAPNPSQHQSLFQWVNSSYKVAKVLEFQLQHRFLQRNPRAEWTCWISLQSKGLSRVFSNSIVQKHQFFGAQPSSQFHSHIQTWPQEKP